MKSRKKTVDAVPDFAAPVLTEKMSRTLLDMVLDAAKERGAQHASVSVYGGTQSNVRFARNGITTNGSVRQLSLSLSVSVNERTSRVSTNHLDRVSLLRAADDAIHAAKHLPKDPEWMAPLGPQKYVPVNAHFTETANASAETRARAAGELSKAAKAAKAKTSGFYETSDGFSALGNTAGLFAYHKATDAELTATTRTDDGTGSGWARSYSPRVSQVDVGAVASGSVQRAVDSANPVEIEPGDYPVILEPQAVADLIGNLAWVMNARSADEGRSFFSKKGGGNKIGEKIVDERMTLRTDPTSALTLDQPWSGSGLAVKPLNWIENGVLKNLSYGRFWAKKQGKAPTSGPRAITLSGSGATTSLADMVSNAKRAVRITRLWYIRSLDPKQVLLTGLTRDGLFWIENGKMTKSLANFRFNESPIRVLNNVEAFSKPVTVSAGRAFPALLVKKFRFSTVSKAV